MSRYGRRPRTWDQRDYIARPARAHDGEYVNLESGMPPIWDQGQLGSCVEHGTAAAYAYARTKQGLAPVDPSRLFGYYAARARAGYPVDQDTGLEVRDGFASLAHDGLPPSSDWPYDIARFAERPPTIAYTDAARDEAVIYGAVAVNAVDAMIASGFPVVIGFDVYESFESQQAADTGVMPVPVRGEQLLGGHCVVLCSTLQVGSRIPGGVPGVLYRRARNSWGSGFGDKGYFWYPDPAMVYASDFWEVQTVSADNPPVPPAPGGDAAFASVLRPWVTKRHVGGNRTVADAAKVWLAGQSVTGRLTGW